MSGPNSRAIFNINNRSAVVDVNEIALLPGDRALIFRHDGSMAIAEVRNLIREGAAARAALEPVDEHGVRYELCTIVGRVVEMTAA